MKSFLVAVLAAAVIGAVSGERVTFTLEAQNIPARDDLSHGDPYVRVYTYSLTNAAPIQLNKIGKSSVLLNEDNPKWPDAFTVELSRGHSQKLRLEVVDMDATSHNDIIGYTDLSVDGLLATSNTTIRAPLSDGGFITLRKTTPIKFKLSASNLPHKDRYWGYDGPSDPYVEIYYRPSQGGRDHRFATSASITNDNNPVWAETFEFTHYQAGQGQYLFFKVYDEDSFTADDFIGQVSVSVDDLVNGKVSNTLSLGAKNVVATLTVHVVRN